MVVMMLSTAMKNSRTRRRELAGGGGDSGILAMVAPPDLSPCRCFVAVLAAAEGHHKVLGADAAEAVTSSPRTLWTFGFLVDFLAGGQDDRGVDFIALVVSASAAWTKAFLKAWNSSSR
jgi:hypothetical protein